MNETIKAALIALLNEEIIVESWGFSNLTVCQSSFEFNVDGIIYQGKVKISLNELSYRVGFDNGHTIDCSLDDLVNTLDINIEKTDDYPTILTKLIFPLCP